MRKPLLILIIVAFLANTSGLVSVVQAQEYYLPAPGVMVHLSPEFNPPILKGIKVNPDNPFKFEFILDKGDSHLANDDLKDESRKLIKYFLASLTIPEKDLWVNLSPYEKDRIIPQSFGLTEMGRDLLAEDYMLKQITASLIYPEDGIGKKFWKRIYEEAEKKFGTTSVPVNTFNKVWIVPEKAVVYENAKAGTAYVVESKLKVMLEQDYLSLQKHEGIQSDKAQIKNTNQLGSQIVREIVIPELTKEVNENKNFSHLRQVYNSLILATWYKKKIKDSILEQVYENKNKVAGVNIDDPKEKERIYQKYLRAFKKGVFNYIKEDVNPATQETIPRKYFSGGTTFDDRAMAHAFRFISDIASIKNLDHAQIVEITLDRAMFNPTEQEVRELLKMLQPYLDQDNVLGFIPAVINVINYIGPGALPDDIRNNLWDKIKSIATNLNSQRVREFMVLTRRLIQFSKLIDENNGVLVLPIFVDGIKTKLADLQKDTNVAILDPSIDLDKLPRSDFFPDAPYGQWQSILAQESPSSLISLTAEFKNKNLSTTRTTEILLTFFQGLPTRLKSQIAQKLIERLNEGIAPPIDDILFNKLYLMSIEYLPKKVGLVHNMVALKALYRNIQKESIDTQQNIWHFFVIDQGTEEEMEENEIWEGFDITNRLTPSFNYNPSPEMLKAAINIWHEEGFLNAAESNRLIWLVGMIPMKAGFTRDRRRQIHRYMLRMVEFRIKQKETKQEESAPKFMGSVISFLSAPDFDKDSINEVLNFILEFSNLSRFLQTKIAEKLQPMLDQWKIEAQGNKSFLKPSHFKELRDKIRETMVDYMLSNMSSDEKQKERLRDHIKQHENVWNKEGFLDLLSSYLGFQDQEGKEYVEDYLAQLMNSSIEGDRFINRQRYNKLKGKIDGKLIQKMQQGEVVDLPLPHDPEEISKVQYEGIYQDILTHLGLVPTGDGRHDLENMTHLLSTTVFEGLNTEEQKSNNEELDRLNTVLHTVLTALSQGDVIPFEQVQEWKRGLIPSMANPPIWYRRNLQWRELAVNLDQIMDVKPVDFSDIKRVTFEITDDPHVFVRSFLEPYPTCQRLTEPTSFNNQGRPINRARQGQFLVASVVLHHLDGSRQIVSRTQLEVALEESKSTLENRLKASILGSKTVLLVERFYQTGLISARMVEREIVKWAKKGNLINYVAFAGTQAPSKLTEEIGIKFISSDGPIYRDTFKEGKHQAINLGLIDDSVNLKDLPVAVSQRAHSSHSSDQAMRTFLNEKGGIDLSPANKVFQIKNGGIGIKFHINPAQLAQLQNAPGFMVVDINIQPLKSLPLWLGINANNSTHV